MDKEKKREPFEAYVCVILFIVMGLAMTLEIIARYIFNSSFGWTEELVRYTFVWFIFISASYAVFKKGHIHVDGLFNLLPNKIKPHSMLLGKVAWLMVSIFAVYVGIGVALNLFSTNQLSASLNMPMGFVYLGIPIGYLLITFRIIQSCVEDIKGIFNMKHNKIEGE